MRNKVVHEGSDGGRSGGWTIFEHLLMAAYVFPLAVKLLLEREGHYVLTDTDRGRCWAVDQLLALAQWTPGVLDGHSRNIGQVNAEFGLGTGFFGQTTNRGARSAIRKSWPESHPIFGP